MKTQINTLRSGTKNQLLNPSIDYTTLAPATSHVGHSGSNSNDVKAIWTKVIAENPDQLNITFKGLNLLLKAHWSQSRKTVSYHCDFPVAQLETCGVMPAKDKVPYMTIGEGFIYICNGKNSRTNICPSLIEIK